MQNLRIFTIALLLTAAMVTVAYLWLDQPISYFAHGHLAQLRIFKELQRVPEFMAAFEGLVFALFGYFVLARRPLNKLLSALLLSGVSLGIASQIKDQLKFLFGRTWPETWINDNPSLIRDGVSGFNFFHGGAGYASFPSGHMTVTCAVVSVLWISYPRYRLLYAAVVAVVAIGLIGSNYHFLSDQIAGGFLGWSTGWISVLFWDSRDLPRLAPEPRPSNPSA